MSPQATVDPLQRFLQARVDEGRMPCAAWFVQAATQVASRGAVGWAMLEPQREPVSGATPFDLASLTKPLVTAPLLALAEQHGLLQLNDSVAGYLNELKGSAYADASLLELAVHAAGLPAWEPLYLGASSIEGYIERIACIVPAVDRGETLYSDLGYILLGAVVERAYGHGLDALFEEKIVEPLGLKSTGYPGAHSIFEHAAATETGNSYEKALAGDAGEDFHWRERIPRGEVHDANAHALGGVAGHAGLFGPIDEVGRLACELVRPQALGLGERARRRLLDLVAPARRRTVGMVAAAHAAAARGILDADAPGHTGFTGTSMWLEPAVGGAYVLLTNRVHPIVPRREFAAVRRGFHRIASRLVRGRFATSPRPL